jgi:hypothetical protein
VYYKNAVELVSFPSKTGPAKVSVPKMRLLGVDFIIS